MTLFNHFKLLSFTEQQQFVNAYGVLIGERNDEKFMIKLYQIEEFYIEVYYLPITQSVKNISCFLNVDGLEPYLQQININDLQ